MTSAVLIPAERPEPAIKANAAPGTLFTTGRSARSGRAPFPATRWATPVVRGARARRSPLRKGQNLAASLRENAKRAPDFLSPAPRTPLASDGRPGTLSDCAGGAKMRGLIRHAGRAASAGSISTKQSQAVTLFPSSSCIPPLCGLDVTGPEAAQLLLRDNLRAFFPFNAGNRISSRNARLKHCQEPVRVRDVVVSVVSCIAAVHGFNHASGDVFCQTNRLYE